MSVNGFSPEPRLPFELSVRVAGDATQTRSEEYEIPQESKQAVLEQMYPFENCPGLNEQKFDINAEKLFFVRDFKVVREGGINYLVSPYYYDDAGTVAHWFDPPEPA